MTDAITALGINSGRQQAVTDPDGSDRGLVVVGEGSERRLVTRSRIFVQVNFHELFSSEIECRNDVSV